jgi:diaminohydroxyphosphoribosylaminopyrimidine deaminase/5-amino-6-(5-phosphoribosylamino)uracil reductase
MYITLEPCTHEGKTPACSSLIDKLRPKKVFVSHYDPNLEAKGGVKALTSSGLNIEYGLLEKEGKELLEPFIKWQDKNFVTFKWAQRLDGTIDGGLVTDETSRKKVHAMRDVCDLLVIGGNTVRTDKPTLDSRLVDGKAPDILIYSKEDNFDKELPLFKIKGREVFIENNLDKIAQYKNILIEGGPSMFEATRDITDRYLCFLAPKTGGKIQFSKEKLELKILQTKKLDNDIMIWMQKKEY